MPLYGFSSSPPPAAPSSFDPETYRQFFEITGANARTCVGVVVGQGDGHCLIATEANVSVNQSAFLWGADTPVAGAALTSSNPFAIGKSSRHPVLVHGLWYILIFNKTVPAGEVCSLFCPQTQDFPFGQNPSVGEVFCYSGVDPYSATDSWEPYRFANSVSHNDDLNLYWPAEVGYTPDNDGVTGVSRNPFIVEMPDGAPAYGGSVKAVQAGGPPYYLTTNAPQGIYALYDALSGESWATANGTTYAALEPDIVGAPQSDPANLPDTSATINTYDFS